MKAEERAAGEKMLEEKRKKRAAGRSREGFYVCPGEGVCKQSLEAGGEDGRVCCGSNRSGGEGTTDLGRGRSSQDGKDLTRKGRSREEAECEPDESVLYITLNIYLLHMPPAAGLVTCRTINKQERQHGTNLLYHHLPILHCMGVTRAASFLQKRRSNYWRRRYQASCRPGGRRQKQERGQWRISALTPDHGRPCRSSVLSLDAGRKSDQEAGIEPNLSQDQRGRIDETYSPESNHSSQPPL